MNILSITAYSNIWSEGRDLLTAGPAKLYLKHPWVKRQIHVSRRGHKKALDRAERVVLFMDATGLTPVGRAGWENGIVWERDGRRLVTVEPVLPHGREKTLAEVDARGLVAVEYDEWGMWNPPHTGLFLASKDEVLLDATAARLDGREGRGACVAWDAGAVRGAVDVRDW